MSTVTDIRKGNVHFNGLRFVNCNGYEEGKGDVNTEGRNILTIHIYWNEKGKFPGGGRDGKRNKIKQNRQNL